MLFDKIIKCALPVTLTGICVITLGAPTFAMADEVITVYPTAETTRSVHADDTLDDTCIWIHPKEEEQSLVIGDDKDGGICVWNMDGSQQQYLDEQSYTNNLDLRYEFNLGNEVVALVGVINETTQSLDFYKVNPVTRQLEASGTIPLAYKKPYGGCMYKNTKDNAFYFFVNWKDGRVEQWKLDGSTGAVTGSLARTFDVGEQVEGCVADDINHTFYIGEENTGLWKYSADPNANDARTLIDSVDASAGGHLVADVEGMTLYYGEDSDEGYLICSSQGDSTYHVYDRSTNAHLGAFRIGATDKIDEATETDGCDVSNVDLGGDFSKGIFVAHDHSDDGSAYSNHKFVPWKSIAKALNLIEESDYDPTKGTNKGPDLEDIEDCKVKVNETLNITVKATDKENHKISLYALNLPEGATFDATTGQFSWTPAKGTEGEYKVVFVGTDGYQISDEHVKIKVK